jgi:hypothetical protein
MSASRRIEQRLVVLWLVRELFGPRCLNVVNKEGTYATRRMVAGPNKKKTSTRDRRVRRRIL